MNTDKTNSAIQEVLDWLDAPGNDLGVNTPSDILINDIGWDADQMDGVDLKELDEEVYATIIFREENSYDEAN